MANLELRGIRKRYSGAKETIKGIDLEIKDGEFVVFVGPSGCGKSTLLRMIAGLEDITGGDLLIDGTRANDIGPAERGLAMVFQSYALYPHMTVGENMGFSLKLAGVPKAERQEKVLEAARVLQLEKLLDRRPRDLSGGQRQRVAIGRAIVRKPKIFLFDEPLSNLDAALRLQMRVELAALHKELGATMIYVTHDQTEAMTMADRIVVLNAGRVEQVGSPLDLYHHPKNLFVASFLGSPGINLLEGKVTRLDRTGLDITLRHGGPISVPVKSGGLRIGDTATLGIRPENLRVEEAGPLSGKVLLTEHLGGLTYVHVKLKSGETVIMQSEGSEPLRPGDELNLAFVFETCQVFHQDGQALEHINRHELVAELEASSSAK
ncbi:sn-glycerol-3-phosphate ABC transporter ATP-binding protein UgpC [Acetobacteraceae bacterium H6797]|nr:sn-glycerol-3-phosphate ABC transporter ATP-binding protein UgpC [Acetobacteraceae bacterium H6797]